MPYVLSSKTAPDDYFPLNLFLVFTPGTQYITVTLHAFEDRIVEPELEWFSLSLGVLIVPAGRVVFSKPNATIFIEDTNSELMERGTKIQLLFCSLVLLSL